MGPAGPGRAQAGGIPLCAAASTVPTMQPSPASSLRSGKVLLSLAESRLLRDCEMGAAIAETSQEGWGGARMKVGAGSALKIKNTRALSPGSLAGHRGPPRHRGCCLRR